MANDGYFLGKKSFYRPHSKKVPNISLTIKNIQLRTYKQVPDMTNRLLKRK